MKSTEGRGYYDLNIDWDGAVGVASQTGRAYGCLYSAGKYLVRLGRKTSTTGGMVEDLEKVVDFLARAEAALETAAVNTRYGTPIGTEEINCGNMDECIHSILHAIQQVGIDRAVGVARIRGCATYIAAEIASRKAELR